MKIHKKIKIGTLEIGTSAKVKFWGYNEKNMGFHLTPKKYYFRLSSGG